MSTFLIKSIICEKIRENITVNYNFSSNVFAYTNVKKEVYNIINIKKEFVRVNSQKQII